MKKVEVLSADYADSLEIHVNRFLKDHPNVTDIQFRVSDDGKHGVTYAVMIVYEDGEIE